MRTTAFLFLPLLVMGTLPQQAPVLRSQSNVVLVPTMVKDANGEVVYGLTADDFIVEDDVSNRTRFN